MIRIKFPKSSESWSTSVRIPFSLISNLNADLLMQLLYNERNLEHIDSFFNARQAKCILKTATCNAFWGELIFRYYEFNEWSSNGDLFVMLKKKKK